MHRDWVASEFPTAAPMRQVAGQSAIFATASSVAPNDLIDATISSADLDQLDYTLGQIKLAIHPLAHLVDDPDVIEIMINTATGVSFERRGGQIQNTTLRVDRQSISHLSVLLASFNHTSLAITDVQLDADMGASAGPKVQMSAEAHGWRFEYQGIPVSLDGPCLTIRRIASDHISLADYVRWGTLTEQAADALRRLIDEEKVIIVGGAVSTGKTTFLGALLREIPLHKRVLTIERVGELRVPHPSRVRLDCGRNPHFDASAALQSALRSRPDWIIVGEVRGPEAFQAIDSAESGHAGLMSIHAKDEQRALNRLATYALEARDHLGFDNICRRVAAGIDAAVQMKRIEKPDGSTVRRVTSISRVSGFDPVTSVFKLEPIFSSGDQ